MGDRVNKGDVLATIEANESLQSYQLLAPSSGEIIRREANAGEIVDGKEILILADLSSVWVELAAFQHDLDYVKTGQSVTIRDADGHQGAVGVIQNIAPIGSPTSQSMTARVVLPNEDGYWRPGLFVSGEVTVASNEVALAVRREALQTYRDWTVVYLRDGDTYEVRPVMLGRQGSTWVEVLEGLQPNDEYVTSNSYMIKADIEKSGAKHDH
jgi:cobalt-zinc-cadmium efflux system membrane fusion protein